MALPSSPLSRREFLVPSSLFPRILKQKNRLEASVTTLNTSVTNFNPTSISTLGGLLTVLKNSDAVGTNIIAATKVANNTAPLMNGDEQPVINEAFTLIPMVQSLLANLITVRPKIDMVAGVFSARKTVLSAVTLDDSLSNQLITAIGNILPAEYQSVVPIVAQQLQDSFDQTIANYNTHMKGVDLPAIPSMVKNGKVVNA